LLSVALRAAPDVFSALEIDERISEIFAGATHPFRSSWSVNAFASAKLGGHEIFG